MGCGSSSPQMPLEEKLEHMNKTPFGSLLEKPDLEALANTFKRFDFVEGKLLPDSAFVVVVQGSLNVS